MSIFLTEHDIRKLEQFLNNSNDNSRQLSNVLITHSNKNQSTNYFDQFTDVSRFKIWQTSTDREDVLNQLSDMLLIDESAGFKQELLDQIAQRELLSAITFNDVIAVPHPARAISKVPKIAIGVIPSGLKWSNLYPNIKLVFLLSPSYLNNQGLMATTQTIVQLVENSTQQSDLVAAKNFSDFRQKFILFMKGGKSK